MDIEQFDNKLKAIIRVLWHMVLIVLLACVFIAPIYAVVSVYLGK